jgi:hypothetical protein
MGLLDDAIREHLELKRRRGADPDEIARLQDEALGDPRSGEFARPGGEPPEPAEPVEPVEEDVPAAPPEPAAFVAAPEPPDEPWLEDERAEAEPESVPPTAEHEPAAVEPDVIRPDDEPGAEEDVLEETPEFLQETPEHDRLWFEQKPPRDFDFDK